jgi:hypothetical protein
LLSYRGLNFLPNSFPTRAGYSERFEKDQQCIRNDTSRMIDALMVHELNPQVRPSNNTQLQPPKRCTFLPWAVG